MTVAITATVVVMNGGVITYSNHSNDSPMAIITALMIVAMVAAMPRVAVAVVFLFLLLLFLLL